MDYILEKGDHLYKSLNVYTPLCIDELPRHVNIEGCSLTVRLLSQEQGNISNKKLIALRFPRICLAPKNLKRLGEITIIIYI